MNLCDHLPSNDTLSHDALIDVIGMASGNEEFTLQVVQKSGKADHNVIVQEQVSYFAVIQVCTYMQK